jgi:hypothetical protein
MPLEQMVAQIERFQAYEARDGQFWYASVKIN